MLRPPLQIIQTNPSTYFAVPAHLSGMLRLATEEVASLDVGLISYSLGGSLLYLSENPFLPIHSSKFYDFDISLNYVHSANAMLLCGLLVDTLNRYSPETGMIVKDLELIDSNRAIAFAYFQSNIKILIDIFLHKFPTQGVTQDEQLNRICLYFLDRFKRTNSIFWVRPNVKDPNMVFMVLTPEIDPSRIIKRYLSHEFFIGKSKANYDYYAQRFIDLNPSDLEGLAAMASEIYSSPRIRQITSLLQVMEARHGL